jgi:predicted ArsR family transcriptional regulator
MSVEDERHRLGDSVTLRALTHPVRIALIEALTIHGSMTATEASQRIGESPTTCSFHLRQLAKYGFVEEAGGGPGRRRPWKLTTIGAQIAGAHDDPATEIAASALKRALRERNMARYRDWIDYRHVFPRVWREAASESRYTFYMTAAELEQLEEQLSRILVGHLRERLTEPSTRPPGAVPVELLTLSYPIELPTPDDEA